VNLQALWPNGLVTTACCPARARPRAPGLRSPEDQLWLGRLAQCPNVHLAASVDHVNAALLWDARACARFR
jgi:hypothetical protein